LHGVTTAIRGETAISRVATSVSNWGTIADGGWSTIANGGWCIASESTYNPGRNHWLGHNWLGHNWLGHNWLGYYRLLNI
jgi:hypothetical protein